MKLDTSPSTVVPVLYHVEHELHLLTHLLLLKLTVKSQNCTICLALAIHCTSL